MALTKPEISTLALYDFTAGAAWAFINPGSDVILRQLTKPLPGAIGGVIKIGAKLMLIGRFLKNSPLGFPNPTLRVGQFVLGENNAAETAVALVATCVGALVGTKALQMVLRMSGGKPPESLKPLKPRAGMSAPQVVLAESLVAASYIVCVLRLIKGGNLRAGLLGLIAVLIMGKKHTGPGLDPASVLARAIAHNYYPHLTNYLTGSAIGGVAGGLLIKLVLGMPPAPVATVPAS